MSSPRVLFRKWYVTAWLEFELAYYNVAVQHVSHYATGIQSSFIWLSVFNRNNSWALLFYVTSTGDPADKESFFLNKAIIFFFFSFFSFFFFFFCHRNISYHLLLFCFAWSFFLFVFSFFFFFFFLIDRKKTSNKNLCEGGDLPIFIFKNTWRGVESTSWHNLIYLSGCAFLITLAIYFVVLVLFCSF